MILILSERKSISIQLLIHRAKYFNVPYLLIDENSNISIITITLDYFILKINNVVVHCDDISGYFFYGNSLKISAKVIGNIDQELNELIKSLKKYEFQELYDLNRFIHYILEKKEKKIGSINTLNVNKLCILDIARQCNLLVPDTLITESLNEIKAFCSNNNKYIITKPISNTLSYIDNDYGLAFLTYVKNVDPTESTTDTFAPSFFQKNIVKRYEIRSFYLKGEFYSMAIFSQNNESTMTDFRVIKTSSLRCVRYKLPPVIEDNITKLMNKINYDTGSIDIIKSIDGHYYFLEVNPIGIFDMVSRQCNYGLEGKLFNILTN